MTEGGLKTNVAKMGDKFSKYVLPAAAFFGGVFGGQMIFGFAADALYGVGTEKLDTIFGAGRDGVTIIIGLILLGIGFSLFKDGELEIAVASFLIGAGLAACYNGFKGVSWTAGE